jgi:hypothetical protein
MRLKSNLILVRLDSANLDTNRYTVCTEYTTGSETILDTPDGTPM